jgi:proteasome lid subunit RPN8/RPN11
VTIKYRTKDGRADYEFSFERRWNGEWRAYIVSQPSYGGRDTSLEKTHRYSNGRRKYVCWTTALYTQDDIRKVAALWADKTQDYIKYGTPIASLSSMRLSSRLSPRSPRFSRGGNMAIMRLTREVYNQIAATIGSLPAERGGALGYDEGDDVIRYFKFDEDSRNSGATYSPDHVKLNEMFRSDWNPRGIRLAGFVHSHPSGCMRPSRGDLDYSRRILAAIPDMPHLFLPIVQTEPDTGKFTLFAFLVTRHRGDVVDRPVRLEILDAISADKSEDRQGADVPESDIRKESVIAWPDETFNRVTEAYDLTRMARARVVIVGVGGAATFVEDLARCGVGEFVLIDGDVVSETNIATQQVYRRDIGRAKVTALADRLRDINPAVRIREVRQSMDDLDDAAMRSLCREPFGAASPEVSLLCGLTDSFYAQARVNALALHLGLPSLCAQVYKEGRGAEITFTYPGLTPACHRCILSSRYKAFIAEQFSNNVTSHGTPIFATSRLNSIKGFVALALLHHRPDGPAGSAGEGNARPARLTGLATRIGDRNLLQIRLDPDIAESLGIGTFERVFGSGNPSLIFDETVWRRQAPESRESGVEPCPDCGGTGDLRNAIGTFDDTRHIRGAKE